MLRRVFQALEIDRYSCGHIIDFMGTKKFTRLIYLNTIIIYTDLESKLVGLDNHEK